MKGVHPECQNGGQLWDTQLVSLNSSLPGKLAGLGSGGKWCCSGVLRAPHVSVASLCPQHPQPGSPPPPPPRDWGLWYSQSQGPRGRAHCGTCFRPELWGYAYPPTHLHLLPAAWPLSPPPPAQPFSPQGPKGRRRQLTKVIPDFTQKAQSGQIFVVPFLCIMSITYPPTEQQRSIYPCV